MDITPEMARAELDRRRKNRPAITPEMARAELDRRAAPQKRNMIGSAIDSVAQGLTFGTSDEIEAGIRTGAGLWGDYGKTLSEVRGQMEQGDKDYPLTSLAGEIAGGIGGGAGLYKSGLSRAKKAAGKNFAKRAGAAAVDGALGAGAYEFGKGKGVQDRIDGAWRAMPAGAAFGAGFEGLTTAGGALYRGMSGNRPGVAATARKNVDLAGSRGVPLSRGQATGDIGQQVLEEQARHGAMGDAALGKATRFGGDQQTALNRAVSNQVSDVGLGAGQQGNYSDDLYSVSDSIRERAAGFKSAADDAYGSVRGSKLKFKSGALPDLQKRISGVLKNEIIPENYSAVRAVAQSADNFMAGIPENAVAIDWKGVEQFRRSLISKKGADSGETRLLVGMRNALDSWIDDAVDNALFSGSAADVSALKRGRLNSSEYFRLTKPNPGDDAGRIISKMANGQATPSEVANWIVGVGKIGKKGASQRTVARIIKEFGGDSPEVGTIRQSIARKLLTDTASGSALGPQKMASNIADFLDGEGRGMARLLFSDSDYQSLDELGKIAKLLVPNEKATNPSKTSYTLLNRMSGLFSKLAPIMGFAVGDATGLAAGSAMSLSGIGSKAAKASKAFNSPVPYSGRISAAPAMPVIGNLTGQASERGYNPLQVTIGTGRPSAPR